MREQSQVTAAILRYNNSMAYAENVMGWAAAYATGVAPVDLPTIVGPAPPIADLHLEHLENPEGLGPQSIRMHGMSPVEHTGGSSLIDLSQSSMETQLANLPWLPPWMRSTEQQLPRPAASCRMICLEPAPETAAIPNGAAPAAPAPPQGLPEPQAPMPPYAVAPAPPVDPAAPAGPVGPADAPQAVPAPRDESTGGGSAPLP